MQQCKLKMIKKIYFRIFFQTLSHLEEQVKFSSCHGSQASCSNFTDSKGNGNSS